MNIVNEKNYFIQPFGERSFEHEKDVLGESWNQLFFEHAPFNLDSLLTKTYLIVGRRGSGKSSLAEHFNYQNLIPNSRSANVDQASEYMADMVKISKHIGGSADLLINSLVNVWEFIIWQLIYKTYKEEDLLIASALYLDYQDKSSSKFVKILLKGILNKYIADTGDELIGAIEQGITNAEFKKLKSKVLNLARHNPLIITIDSREQYSVEDQDEMNIAAALIQCASKFNRQFAKKGLHLKVFLPDEIFPHIKEDFVLNTAKSVRDPLFLHWRPKDLVRLICWRYFKYLKYTNYIKISERDIDWDDFSEVRKKMWNPYFGRTLKNNNGIDEGTLPYIIRHSQLRPRQLIMICNTIAGIAKKERTFPVFSENALREAVKKAELELADELINSYSRIYKNAGDIISALSGLPMIMPGKELDRIAPRTASQWKSEPYSPLRFRQIVAELGIVGRERGQRDLKTGIVEADFEFAMRDRLFIHEQDNCVIHPMFYLKLNTTKIDDTVIYPFPDHPDFEILRE